MKISIVGAGHMASALVKQIAGGAGRGTAITPAWLARA